MIRPVDTSLLDAVAKTTPSTPVRPPAAHEPTGKNTFASQLKRETQKAAENGGVAAAKTSSSEKTEEARNRTANRVKPPEGEKWRPVKGHDDYAEIIAGPRKGQYVNLTRGDRRGEAFSIEEREGKKVHVYKKDGKDVVVPLEDDLKASRNKGRRPTPPKGETWAPVEGKPNYADILTGKRNGYYVNLVQGSVREGEVFHIVKRGNREYHVYGEGKDKVWVEVGPNKRKKKSEGAESTQPANGAADNRDANQSTGGTNASSGASGSSSSGSSNGGASAS